MFFTRFVSLVAAIVVFITTYALVLPAITLEKTASCGIDEHQHDDSCYEYVLTCGQEESEGHHHDNSCYTVTRELECQMEEHQHSQENGCYDEEGNLICQLAEHAHDDSCYSEKKTLTCDQQESEGHQHTDACYEKVLVCDKEVHIHSAKCYKDEGNAEESNEEAADQSSSVSVSEDSAVETETEAASGETLPDTYVPELDPLNMEAALSKNTGFYYFHAEEGQEVPDNSTEITDWQEVKEDTELAPTDLVKMYLPYTIPAGSLNETNPTARYRLPENIHLTDEQIKAINKNENGIYAAYLDSEFVENADQYLGAEAVEGDRSPDEQLQEGTYEYISAVVRAENVYDEEGLYGEKGAYLGQDLIFTFIPYSIEKNKKIYDADGNQTSAGNKITGWFACDFRLDQIDWEEQEVKEETQEDSDQSAGDTALNAVEKTADIIFVSEDKDADIREIKQTLKLEEKRETSVSEEEVETVERATEKAAEEEAEKASEEAGEETERFRSGSLTADGDGYKITLDYTEEAKIPESASLSVREITAETDKEAYEACLAQAQQHVDESGEGRSTVDSRASRFFDIEILVTDEEGTTQKIEPAAPVSVNIQIADTPAEASDSESGSKEAQNSDPTVLHFAEEGVEQIEATASTGEKADENRKPDSGVDSGTDTYTDSGKASNEVPESAEITEIRFEAESFSIYGVVYAQISKTVIDAKGDTWKITVSYGEDAQIPDGAELRVEEITEGHERYNQDRDKAVEALFKGTIDNFSEEDDYTFEGTGDALGQAVIFDISIVYDGKIVEPKPGSKVLVDIRVDSDFLKESEEEHPGYIEIGGTLFGTDVVENESDSAACVIHIDENGNAEQIESTSVSSTENEFFEYEFTTDSFSDYVIDADGQVTKWDGSIERYFLNALPTTLYVGDTINIVNHAGITVTNQNPNGIVTVTNFSNRLNGDNGNYRVVKLNQTGTFTLGGRNITVVDRPTDTPPDKVSTVSNNDIGATLNIFDYDLDNYLDDYFNQFNYTLSPYWNYFRNHGVNNGHVLKFWGSGVGDWDQGSTAINNGWIDYRNIYQDGATTNIVQNRLVNGYPYVNGSNGESLDYLFGGRAHNDVEAHTGVDGLFQKDQDGYYYYDSNSNYAYLNGSTFDVYKSTYTQWSKSDSSSMAGYDNGKAIGFFPFHQWNSQSDLFVNWDKGLNHHFGMEFDLQFQLPDSSKGMALVDRNGKPFVFEFSGDDDVWVFIDDRLVMDIGGIHQPVAGKIDFTNKTVTVGNNTQIASNNSIWNTLHLDDGQPHTLKMFYIERGGCDSNNMIKFNLTHYTDIEFVKLDNVTEEPLEGVTYELWEVIRYNDEDGNPQVKYEQAFWWENRNGSAVKHAQHVTTEADGKVLFEHVPVGEYLLKEISAPSDYVLNEDKTLHVTLQKNSDGSFHAVWNEGDLDELSDPGVQVTNKKPVIDISVNKTWLDVDGQPMDASAYSATFTLHRTKSWTEIVEEEGEPEKSSTLRIGYYYNDWGGTHYGYYDNQTYHYVVGSDASVQYNYNNSHNNQNYNWRRYRINRGGTEVQNIADNGTIPVTMPPEGETVTVYLYDNWRNGSTFSSLSANGQTPQNTVIQREIPHVDEPDSFTSTLTLSNGATSGRFDSGRYPGTPDAGKFPYQETIQQPDGTKITYTYKYYITEESVPGFSSSPSQAGPTGEEDFTGDFVNRKLLSAKIKKVWDHGTNEGEFPSSLTVILSNGQTVVLNEDNDWEATITDLPKFDNEGHPISYSWTEGSLPAGYYLSDVSETESGDVIITTLTNTYTDRYMPETTILGKKIWDDKGDANRPASINVNLYQGNSSTPFRTITVNAPTGEGANQDEWPFEFTNLPVFNEDGTVIQYRVEEVLPEGYADDYNINIQFEAATYIPGEITGEVITSGQGSQTFDVSRGVDLGYIVIKHGNNFIIWTPRRPSEEEVEKIRNKAQGLSNDFSDITSANNIYYQEQQPHGAHTIQVIWGVPKTVSVGSKQAVSFSMDGDIVRMTFLNPSAWSAFCYGNIPYTYTPAGGNGGGSITNIKKVIDISGTKTWLDGDRTHVNEQEITLTLKRTQKPVTDDSEWETVEATPSWNGNSYTFSDLPRYQDVNDLSTEFEYKVEETSINVSEGEGDDQQVIPYMQEDDGEGNFTNTELINIEAVKTWKVKHAAINSTIRNASVTFKLQKKVGSGEWTDVPSGTGEAENPQTLAVENEADENAWKAEWNNLPKYELVEGEAVEVLYQVVETEAIISGISVKPESDPAVPVTDGTADVNNTLPETEFSVTKQWKDGLTDTGGNDCVFDEARTIHFTVYQKVGNNEATIYEAYGINGKGSVTYTPGEESCAGTWSTEIIQNLPKYMYDETTETWVEASYYVVEDDITGVAITYKKGSGDAGETAAASMITGSDEGDDRLITIINTDLLMPVRIVKVDSIDGTGLSGARFQMTRKLPGEGSFTKFVNSIFEEDEENDNLKTGPFTVSSSDGIIIEGLHPGEYKIEEKTAPDGYIISLQPFTFTVNADGTLTSSDADSTLVIHLEQNGDNPEGFQIGNKPGAALPHTGGPGTRIFTILGSILIAGAGLLLWRRRRTI